MIRKTIATLALAGVALCVTAAVAAASTSSGYHSGYAQNPLIQGAVYPAQSAQFQVGSSDVQRSPYYGGRQYVRAAYYLYGWSGASNRWIHKAYASDGCRLEPDEYCITDPRAWNVSGYADWTIDITYTWQTPSGGLIGYRKRHFGHSSDYACYVPSGLPSESCAIRPHGGRYGMFIWGS